MCLCFHNWGDWVGYGVKHDLIYFGSLFHCKAKDRKVHYKEERRRRECGKCGKIQDKKVIT
jgi:hypothetical protein